MINRYHSFGILALMAVALGCATSSEAMASRKKLPELKTVPYVDVQRYLGKWYEIASFPQRFQRNCVATTATYSLRDDGDIRVENECRDKTLDGKVKRARGKAWIVDETTNAKLKVRFFWPFRGDYWIIDLGQDYEFAVVGHPDRDYLWILSRTPQMNDDVYQGILKRLEDQHYDLKPLQRTLQPSTSP
jgi:apolipoprotein D and lipocalin family protein